MSTAIAQPTPADMEALFLEVEEDALPCELELMRDKAWKAWTRLSTRLEQQGQSLMFPSGDAPEFVKWVGDYPFPFPQFDGCVIARFFNSSDWLTCFVYDWKKDTFTFSEELTEFMHTHEDSRQW